MVQGFGGGDLFGVEADLPAPGLAVCHVPVLLLVKRFRGGLVFKA